MWLQARHHTVFVCVQPADAEALQPAAAAVPPMPPPLLSPAQAASHPVPPPLKTAEAMGGPSTGQAVEKMDVDVPAAKRRLHDPTPMSASKKAKVLSSLTISFTDQFIQCLSGSILACLSHCV